MADKPSSDKGGETKSTEVDADEYISSDRAYSRRPRTWAIFLTYFLIALAFAFAIVLFGRWVYHRVHKSETTTVQPAGDNTPAPATDSSSNSSSSSSSNSNNQTSTGANTAQTSGEVPNTGPGNVIALFIGTAVIVGGLHFVYSLRRT